MKLTEVCKSYFNGFYDIYHYKENNIKKNVLGMLKVLSYFTGVITLAFATIYGLSLCGRVNKKQNLLSQDKNVDNQAKKVIKGNNPLNSTSEPHLTQKTPTFQPPVENIAPLEIFPPSDAKIVPACTGDLTQPQESSTLQTPVEEKKSLEISLPLDANVVRAYTSDLTQPQKTHIKAHFIDDYTLKISFQQFPLLDFTIRRQNIFNSQAQVIVNAANNHLGGGRGIDGAIHAQGGDSYAKAHRALKEEYKSNYVSGYAAMIDSGALKQKYHIDNVIVVAGPSGGQPNPQKENELYSCYYNSLLLAHSQNKTSIAFPAISTGIFGFSKDRAAHISQKAVYDFFNQHPNSSLKAVSIHFLPNEGKENLEDFR